MVRDVKPFQNYTIEIRMRNKRGSGPPAKVQVATPAEPQSKDGCFVIRLLCSYEGYLIYSGNREQKN